jgi:hypothetical protein
METTHIAGDCWIAYVDKDYGIWRGSGAGVDVPLKKLLEQIPPDRIKSYSDTSTYYGREYGLMYPDAAQFLNGLGFKCVVKNLPPIIPEGMELPIDDSTHVEIPDDDPDVYGDATLNPTGNEEDGWDYGDASPDDDLDNADWPKRTPDTMAAIEAQIAVAPRRLLFLRGSHWYAWLNYRTLDWVTDSEETKPIRLLCEKFPRIAIRHRGETDEAFRALYDEAAEYLQSMGVQVIVVGC